MHSIEYLLREVQEKLNHVETVLSQCETERCLLSKNFDVMKDAIKGSIERHVETLQCREKWLNCHAGSIFHLKQGSLSHQIAELEQASSELRMCIEATKEHTNVEDFRNLVKDTLKKVDDGPLMISETGSMLFSADNAKLEEMIIDFGEIAIHSGNDETPYNGMLDFDETPYNGMLDFDETPYNGMLDFELLSDDGICVLKAPVKEQRSIEMEVKSIEMHHMTSQSASLEKQDHEKVDIELKELTELKQTCLNPWLRTTNQLRKDYTVKHDMDLSQWLYTIGSDQKPKDDELHGSSNSKDKVQSWLMNCREDNNWISTNVTKNISACTNINGFEECDLPLSHWLIKRDRKNKGNPIRISEEERVPPIENPLMEFLNEEQNIIDVESELNLSYDVIREVSKHKTPIWSLSSDSDTATIPDTITNIHQFDDVLLSDDLKYLQSKEFRKISTSVHIEKLNEALKHMQFLHEQPSSAYLHKPVPQLDPSLCQWLAGKSDDRCNECRESCAFEMLDKQWIKTATDW